MTNTSRGPDAWLRHAVIHQIYIRSFADGNGDGVGDVNGIRSRLDHCAALGVDGVWITPWYTSPMADGGYDVSDHRDIDPAFGTLAQAEVLIAEAHALGLRVMLDVVPNHTSDEHPWFRDALASRPGSPRRRRYVFRDGLGREGELPPNDWRSCFGGPAWTRTTDADGRPGQWYLHLFTPRQPDLNWDDAEVRAEFLSIMRFWLQRGVDGFRVDVAFGMLKAPGLPDVGYAGLDLGPHQVAAPWHVPDHPHWDRPGLREIYREWRGLAADHPHVAFVAEAEVSPIARYAHYLGPDGLHSVFNFPFMKAPWDAAALREVIDETIHTFASAGAVPNWVLGNHDVARVATRLAEGDPARGVSRARAAALLSLGLPGGAYIYQGDELGLGEVDHFTPDELRDPIATHAGGTLPVRDGCRVPLPWSGQDPPFGFSPADAGAPPWLRQPEAWRDLTVQAQAADPSSTLSMYRSALALRRRHPDLAGEDIAWLDGPDGTLHFARGARLAVIVNVSAAPVTLPRGARVLVASGPMPGDTVPRDAAVWYERP